MDRLAEIEEQVKKLQAEAATIKKEKASAAISKIKDLMSQHGITLEDLGAGAKKIRKTSQVKAMYRDPDSVQEWSGRGRSPKWMKDQLDAGKKKEDFLIKN